MTKEELIEELLKRSKKKTFEEALEWILEDHYRLWVKGLENKVYMAMGKQLDRELKEGKIDPTELGENIFKLKER